MGVTADVILRRNKGAPLSITEADSNFANLSSAVASLSAEIDALGSSGGLTVVGSITALKAVDSTKFSRALVTGYYNAGDNGGGNYRLDATDTTSADNGGTIIVGTDGGRWKLLSFDNRYTSYQFGCVGDGTTDDYPKLSAALAALPDGSTLYLRGGLRIATPITITGRISLICETPIDYILADVGTSFDAINYIGPAGGINGVDIRLNVYGHASCGRSAVVLARVDRSRIRLDVHGGFADKALRLRGCLINHVYLQSSGNYTPPISSPGFQAKHIGVEMYLIPSATVGTASISGPASPAVASFGSAHGRSAGDAVAFYGTLPAPMVEGKPYYVLSTGLTSTSFRFSETNAGSAFATTGAGTSCTCKVGTAYASNTNDIYGNFEGGGDGYTQDPMPGEGSNHFWGEIEGTSGSPLVVKDSLGFSVSHLNMEANSGIGLFTNCNSLTVGTHIVNLGSNAAFSFSGCVGYTIDDYYGSLIIDSTNTGGKLGRVFGSNVNVHLISDKTCEQLSGIPNSTDPTTYAGGPGASSLSNKFVNPYLDLWASAGTSAPPVGCTAPNGALVSRVTSPRYPGNPNIYSARVTATVAAINNGLWMGPTFNPIQEDGWISAFVPMYVATGQPGYRVWIFDGNAYHLIGENTTQKDQWVEHRGSIKCIPGNSHYVVVSIFNGTTYPSSGQCFVGGCGMNWGAVPMKHLSDDGQRDKFVIQTIANTPDFQWQRAVSGGNAYIAVSNGAPTDWKQAT